MGSRKRKVVATPNPGSDAAIKAGCLCPVIDNARGRGFRGMPGVFVFNFNCPVHGVPKAKGGEQP